MRLVAYIQADLDSSEAVDPLLPEVAWSWLVEALDARTEQVTALGGTVTATTSVRYGDISGPPRAHQLELRASWTATHPRHRHPRRGVLRGARARRGPAAGRGDRFGHPVTRLTWPRSRLKHQPKRPTPRNLTSRRCSIRPTGCPICPSTAGEIKAAAAAAGRRPRPVRGRRRAGLGFPLLQPRLPDSDPAGRRRHRAHRPGQPRRRPADRAAARRRGARPGRVDSARRRSGSAVPGRGRHAAAGAVRHRAGRAAGRLRPGQPGGDGAATARSGAGQGPRRGRLVRASAAGSVAQLRRPRRRGAHRTARGDRGRAGRARQNRLGRRGIRLSTDRRRPEPRRRPAATAGAAPRAFTGCATSAAWPRFANCGRCATKSPSAATSRPGASCPTRRSSTPPSPTRRPSTIWSRCRCSADATAAPQRRDVVGGAEGRPRKPRTRRDEAEPPNGPPPPARWADAGRRPRRGSMRPAPRCAEVSRAGHGADREPGHARPGPAAVLGLGSR